MKDKNACVMKDLSNIINNDRDTELPSFFCFAIFSSSPYYFLSFPMHSKQKDDN